MRLLRYRFCDFYELLITDGQITNQLVRIDIDIELLEYGFRLPDHSLLIDNDPFSNGSSQEDILRYRKFPHQIEFLINYPNSVFFRRRGGERRKFLALDNYLAIIRHDCARATLDQCRFACAVLPDQCMRFAFYNVNAYVVQRNDAWIFLRYIL